MFIVYIRGFKPFYSTPSWELASEVYMTLIRLDYVNARLSMDEVIAGQFYGLAPSRNDHKIELEEYRKKRGWSTK
jgi:hypothetical protein